MLLTNTEVDKILHRLNTKHTQTDVHGSREWWMWNTSSLDRLAGT